MISCELLKCITLFCLYNALIMIYFGHSFYNHNANAWIKKESMIHFVGFHLVKIKIY